ncbi:MAG: pre-peptidase C-terminal domain-containing protein [Marmoricola sp.]
MRSARKTFRSRLVWGVALAGIAATYLGAGASTASTPTEGTVSDTQPVTSWGGGPFAAPNATGEATGAPDCTVPQSCDDFNLHVNTSAAYGSTHTLKVDVSWANSAADFDLYVLDAAGSTVATSASSADPEEVVLPPATGTYTVRVVPFAPAGES